MTREEAAPLFNAAIAHLRPIVDREVAWPQINLRQRVFVSDIDLPEVMVSSVRALVFRGAKVVVVRMHEGQPHINPGGRREAGETIEQTARREVLEECGWELGPLTPFALHHFQHLGERPAEFPAIR